MIIGGVNLEGDQTKTYIVDPKENFKSSDGPSMNYKRSEHGCGSTVFNDKDYVMVIGGWGVKKKTELYYSGNKNWTERKLITISSTGVMTSDQVQ